MRTASAGALRAYLERRRERLSAEIRGYPTPIARCDVQLAALLEARAEVVRLLERADGPLLAAGFRAAAAGWGEAEAERLAGAPVRPCPSSG